MISTMATDGKAIRETIDGCEYFEYQIYACDEPNPHADSCFAVITDADAPDNAGRANDLTTSTTASTRATWAPSSRRTSARTRTTISARTRRRTPLQETGGGKDVPQQQQEVALRLLVAGIEPGRVVLGDASRRHPEHGNVAPPDLPDGVPGGRGFDGGPPRCRRRCLPDRLRALRAERLLVVL